jgi:hypothetical protein
LIFGVGSIFLFRGSPGYYAPDWLGDLWQLGHIGLLAIGGTAFIRTFRKASDAGLYRGGVPLFIATLIFALATESIQATIGRTFSLTDILRDLLGAGLAYAAHTHRLWRAQRKHLVGPAFIVFSLLVALIPLASALSFEVKTRQAFPVIADFEETSELRKCSGRSEFSLSRDAPGLESQSLKVVFGTSKYSGITLRHFPRDWSGRERLTFTAELPDEETLDLALKVHDLEHTARGTRYSDRFNKTIRLTRGLNKLSVPLTEIASAPRDRAMDMTSIVVIQLFASELPEKKLVYLDDFRLE